MAWQCLCCWQGVAHPGGVTTSVLGAVTAGGTSQGCHCGWHIPECHCQCPKDCHCRWHIPGLSPLVSQGLSPPVAHPSSCQCWRHIPGLSPPVAHPGAVTADVPGAVTASGTSRGCHHQWYIPGAVTAGGTSRRCHHRCDTPILLSHPCSAQLPPPHRDRRDSAEERRGRQGALLPASPAAPGREREREWERERER